MKEKRMKKKPKNINKRQANGRGEKKRNKKSHVSVHPRNLL